MKNRGDISMKNVLGCILLGMLGFFVVGAEAHWTEHTPEETDNWTYYESKHISISAKKVKDSSTGQKKYEITWDNITENDDHADLDVEYIYIGLFAKGHQWPVQSVFDVGVSGMKTEKTYWESDWPSKPIWREINVVNIVWEETGQTCGDGSKLYDRVAYFNEHRWFDGSWLDKLVSGGAGELDEKLNWVEDFQDRLDAFDEHPFSSIDWPAGYCTGTPDTGVPFAPSSIKPARPASPERILTTTWGFLKKSR